MNTTDKTTLNILGVNVGAKPLLETIDFIDRAIESHEKVIVQYVNIHAINLAQSLPWFKTFLNHADLTYCDGYGVNLAAKILGASIPYRYTLPDWFSELAACCNRKGHSIFILGAKPGVAEIAAARIQEKHPELKIVGTYHGYFDKDGTSLECKSVIDMINNTNPDLLAIGLGMPLQEKWLMENWEKLSAWVALPMGAAIDYLAGTTPRAPRWITDHGLEWLGRLTLEPKRLWKRYLLGIPVFYYNVIKQRFGYYSSD